MTVLARQDQIAAGLSAVRTRIEQGCAAAGRDTAEVTLVVVTKTYPASDVELLAAMGVRDVGENRDAEAVAKHAACAGLGLHWHFIGRLQSNKARSVARYADVVHSVDRASLIAPLGRGAREAGRVVECLLQVSLDADPGRGGASAAQLSELAAAVAAEDGLVLRGLMAVAPLRVEPYEAFRVLPVLRAHLLESHPSADLLSAGMSGDLEAALACGATHLRVGTAVLGARPPLA
ncbi:MAG TPA: YggS family pyridoxal phosphate-dependent enzyme [Kineosporiaceae bacterium]|nr:YggS family pyridoxal phosphate-dependent enzyme [Kineosporiaceae bacterium]